MSDIVERLREASVERQQIAWGRIDGGQEWSIAAILADQAADEIERLVALIDNAAAHWIELCRTIHPPIPFEGAIDGAMEAACKEVKRLRARVAELEVQLEQSRSLGKLGGYLCAPEHTWAEWLADRNKRVAELEAEVSARTKWMDDQVRLNEDVSAIIKRLHSRVTELEGEAFRLAANQCHHGYGAENGDHRCKYQDRIAELEPIGSEAAEIRRKWGIESDESLTECVERNIDGWRQRALKAEAAQEWRTIESAPKDGAAFLAVDARSQSHRVVWFDDEAKPPFVWHVDDASGWFNHHADFFTHWLPLPAPPKEVT